MQKQEPKLSQKVLEVLLKESEKRFQEVLEYSTEAAYKRNVPTSEYESEPCIHQNYRLYSRGNPSCESKYDSWLGGIRPKEKILF